MLDRITVGIHTLLAGSTQCARAKTPKSTSTASRGCRCACEESKGPCCCQHLSLFSTLPSPTHSRTHSLTHTHMHAFPHTHTHMHVHARIQSCLQFPLYMLPRPTTIERYDHPLPFILSFSSPHSPLCSRNHQPHSTIESEETSPSIIRVGQRVRLVRRFTREHTHVIRKCRTPLIPGSEVVFRGDDGEILSRASAEEVTEYVSLLLCAGRECARKDAKKYGRELSLPKLLCDDVGILRPKL